MHRRKGRCHTVQKFSSFHVCIIPSVPLVYKGTLAWNSVNVTEFPTILLGLF